MSTVLTGRTEVDNSTEIIRGALKDSQSIFTIAPLKGSPHDAKLRDLRLCRLPNEVLDPGKDLPQATAAAWRHLYVLNL